MIAIVDYGMGNLRSVQKALEKCGATSICVTSSARDIRVADKIVVPGVGAMKEAISAFDRLGLTETIKKSIFKKPYLGICLGLQVLFEESEEGKGAKGLGVFKGKVLRFPKKVKVPHMGWNNIKFTDKSKKYQIADKKRAAIFKNIPDSSYFYFCHSYYAAPSDKSIIAATAGYGVKFAAAIQKDNLFAVQFHPEKSQELGLRILKNFIEL